MIKKTIIYLILTLFTTAVAADELFMKCGPTTFKYINDPAGDKVFWKNRNATKNKYEEWCSNELRKEDITRHIEWYHTNTGNKKNIKDLKCKKKKK